VSVLQCVAVSVLSVLQLGRAAAVLSVLQCLLYIYMYTHACGTLLQCVVLHFTALHCTAACCGVLWCVVGCCSV